MGERRKRGCCLQNLPYSPQPSGFGGWVRVLRQGCSASLRSWSELRCPSTWGSFWLLEHVSARDIPKRLISPGWKLGRRCWRPRRGPIQGKTTIGYAGGHRDVGWGMSPGWGLLLYPARRYFFIKKLRVPGPLPEAIRICPPRTWSWWTPGDGWREAAKSLLVSVPSGDTAQLTFLPPLRPQQVNRLQTKPAWGGREKNVFYKTPSNTKGTKAEVTTTYKNCDTQVPALGQGGGGSSRLCCCGAPRSLRGPRPDLCWFKKKKKVKWKLPSPWDWDVRANIFPVKAPDGAVIWPPIHPVPRPQLLISTQVFKLLWFLLVFQNVRPPEIFPNKHTLQTQATILRFSGFLLDIGNHISASWPGMTPTPKAPGERSL